LNDIKRVGLNYQKGAPKKGHATQGCVVQQKRKVPIYEANEVEEPIVQKIPPKIVLKEHAFDEPAVIPKKIEQMKDWPPERRIVVKKKEPKSKTFLFNPVDGFKEEEAIKIKSEYLPKQIFPEFPDINHLRARMMDIFLY